jgi:hypothetical protein
MLKDRGVPDCVSDANYVTGKLCVSAYNVRVCV